MACLILAVRNYLSKQEKLFKYGGFSAYVVIGFLTHIAFLPFCSSEIPQTILSMMDGGKHTGIIFLIFMVGFGIFSVIQREQPISNIVIAIFAGLGVGTTIFTLFQISINLTCL